MKNLRSYLLVLVMLIPMWDLMAATQHVNRNHIQIHKVTIHSSEHGSPAIASSSDDDDCVLMNEDDDDSDDFSESIVKHLPVAVINIFIAVSNNQFSIIHFSPVVNTARKNSPSYLRVFRI